MTNAERFHNQVYHTTLFAAIEGYKAVAEEFSASKESQPYSVIDVPKLHIADRLLDIMGIEKEPHKHGGE